MATIKNFQAIYIILTTLLLIFGDSLAAEGSSCKKLERKFRAGEAQVLNYNVDTLIKFRYAQTTVTSSVFNPDSEAAVEHSFEVVFPEDAFISGYHVKVGTRSFEATVENRTIPNVPSIPLYIRNAHMVRINATVKPNTRVDFSLSYNQIMTRSQGYYEKRVFVDTNSASKSQEVKVSIKIEETANVTFVRVPLYPEIASVAWTNGSNLASVTWELLGNESISDQCSAFEYIVQFGLQSTDDGNGGGEIIIIGDQMFHIFSPIDLLPLRKHVIFLLDVSGSMGGVRIDQLKSAMIQILGELTPDDFINIITFSTGFSHWQSSTAPIPATPAKIAEAKSFINSLVANGGTDMNDALMEMLRFSALIQSSEALPTNVGTICIFLTDGSVGGTDQILINVANANSNLKIPLHALAFGTGADFSFLQVLALQNQGLVVQIFDGADASEQISGFYKEISSPVLTDVSISYDSTDFIISNLTITNFTTIYGGAEVIIAGTIVPVTPGPGPFKLTLTIQAIGRDGPVLITHDYLITITKSEMLKSTRAIDGETVSAHILIRDLISESLATNSTAAREEARLLSIQNNLVTPLTSMRVRQSKCFTWLVNPAKIDDIAGTTCPTPSPPELAYKNIFGEISREINYD